MDSILNTALDGAAMICLGIAFFSFKFIPTKRHILCHADEKGTVLLKIGTIFWGIGLLLLAIHYLIGIDH